MVQLEGGIETYCVVRCLKTGLIFLSDTGHMDIGHYDQKPPTHRYGVDKRAIVNTNDDSLRRHDRFANLIRGKSWLDIGAGSGAVLDQLAPLAKQAAAVEPQKDASETLEKLGYKVFRRLESVDFDHVDVITLFHVLEHIVQNGWHLWEIVIRIVHVANLFKFSSVRTERYIVTIDGVECLNSSTFWIRF